MNKFLTAGLAAIALSLSANPAAAQEPLPISEYGKLPDVEMATISPSGRRIAIITTLHGRRVIVAFEDQTKVISTMAVDDLKVRYLEWIGDDQLLLVSSQTEKLGFNFTTDKAEFFIARVLPITSDAQGGLIFSNKSGLIDTIVGDYGIREIDGRYYGFYGAIELKRSGRVEWIFDHGRPYLYRVDLHDMSVKKIDAAANAGHSKDWLIDKDGNLAATLDVDDNSGRWKIFGPDRNVVAEGQEAGGRVWLVGLGRDGSSFIFGKRENGISRWYEAPLAGGAAQPFLDDTDVDRLFFDDKTGHLMGYLEGGNEPRPVFHDEDHQKAAAAVRGAFGDLRVRIADWTSDLKSVIARTSGNGDSGSWFAVDLASGRANAFAYERNAIGPEHVGAISTFEYIAKDGMEMDGILTLPPGKEARNLPLVMFPHGGPHSHDVASFDWWAQAFASRGYAVFQPNFRGSTNRNQAFRKAGYGEWGRKMQTDKSDGLAALAEAGIIDPDRACIVGASYGGYAALAGVTVQQDIYRCAVAVAPVSDIGDMYQQDYRATGNDKTTKISLLEQLGPRDSWAAVSPVRLAEKADAPIMLIHGKDDIVVPYSHSMKMADKLKDYGKPYEMVTLEGEDHWLSLSKTRQLMLESAIRFVEEYNPPD